MDVFQRILGIILPVFLMIAAGDRAPDAGHGRAEQQTAGGRQAGDMHRGQRVAVDVGEGAEVGGVDLGLPHLWDIYPCDMIGIEYNPAQT